MADKKTLYDEMKKFQNEKKMYVIVLILLGCVGLILPVLPGLLLIGLGFVMISPYHGSVLLDKVKEKLRYWFTVL